jgi:hypothetical protein
MAFINPHISFPVRFGPNGHLASVEQGTADDVLSCVGLLASVEQGSLPDDRTVGVPDVTFMPAEVGERLVEAALATQEDRAPITAQATDDGAGRISVAVSVDTRNL